MRSLAYMPDGETLLAACDDGFVAMCAAQERKDSSLLFSFSSPSPTPPTTLSPTAFRSQLLRRYDAERGDVLEEFQCHSSWVLGVDVHPDGKSFATAGADGTVKLWEVREGENMGRERTEKSRAELLGVLSALLCGSAVRGGML